MSRMNLSWGEERVPSGVRHRRAEVAEFDAISRVQQELVDADVSVNDAAGVKVTDGVEHLREVAAWHWLGQQTAGRLGEQLTHTAVVAELENQRDAAVDQVMC